MRMRMRMWTRTLQREYAWSPGLTQFHKYESLLGWGFNVGSKSLVYVNALAVVMPHGGRVYGRRRGRGLL